MQANRLWLAAVLLAAGSGAGELPELRLKSGRVQQSGLLDPVETAAQFQASLAEWAGTGPLHFLVQFAAPPAEEQKQALEQRGMRVLSYVPDNAFLVSAAPGVRLDGLDLVWAGWLEAPDKLSAALAAQAESGAIAALVEVHPDAELSVARAWVIFEGLELLENPDLAPNQLLVRGSLWQLERLTTFDEVAYIFPAADELLAGAPLNACLGAQAGLEGLTASNFVATFGSGWDGPGKGAAQLGYYVGALAPRLSADAARGAIQGALAAWSAVVAVDFTPVSSPRLSRSVDIFFAAGNHGDGYPFDGRGRTLAHTFYPPPNAEPIAGDLHFDADENWQIGAGTDVSAVALHELGHALGLGHSDDPNAVMYPYYRRVRELRPADIEAIRTLYGARLSGSGGGGGATPPGTPGTTPPATPTNPARPANPVPPANPPAPPRTDTTAPTLRITSPEMTAFATSAESVVVRGTATDNTGVSRVTWQTTTGTSGTASGTAAWSTPAIPLYRGANSITIKAYDAAGNFSWRSLLVTRR